ncbi:SDR family NAD(P)-dependent oxidoreductase [Rugosimonospora africana]|uniref:Short-chain dehydrogenase n=1 Tax=Rugosimonospora africana TaxID=556532 RepID=A0A8J3QPZ1_9ACTN|nr:SDR family NAD(P)-dependent oxidoreductase [Rugosimonospora africana]GIH13595.1 short-chain dehydrogenase [Rugosimonospora africana]
MTTTIALVTGANKGIGKQTARLLSAAGHTVYLGARDDELGRQAAEELSTGRPGADVRYVALDVTDDRSVSAAADRIAAEAGRLDLLVNNAGISLDRGRPASALTAGEVRETFEVNVFGAVRVIRAMLPLLRRSRPARVLNVSSPLGSVRLLADPDRPEMGPDLLGYCASKAALNAVTVMYANELREAGITVNAVSPGYCATDLNGNRGYLTAAQGAEAVVRAATGAPPATGTFLTSAGATPW